MRTGNDSPFRNKDKTHSIASEAKEIAEDVTRV
jgi:hypothetical protein